MTYPPERPARGGWASRSEDESGTANQRPNWYGNQHTSPGPLPTGRPLSPDRAGPPPVGPTSPGEPPAPPDWMNPTFRGSETVSRPRAQESSTPPEDPATPYGWQAASSSQVSNGSEDVDPPPRKSRVKPVLAALGVLFAAGATVICFALLRGPSSPRPALNQLVDKLNADRIDALGAQFCEANRTRLERQFDKVRAGRFDIRVHEIDVEEQRAAARVTGTYSLSGSSQQLDRTLILRFENGDWKLCDLAR